MKGFVSGGRFSVFALVASLSVVWVAGAITIPSGLPWMAWMGLGWVGLALSTALWVSIRSTRSLARVLRDVEAEPMPAVAAKSGRLAVPTWAHVAWLSLLPVFLSAGTPGPAANLSACKNGWPSCERSRLTLVEMTEVTLAGRARNVSNCRNGLNPCDPWKLTKAEAIATASAAYDRNMSDWREGRDTCDYSLLSWSEVQAITSAERARNYTACLNGRGSCDRSRLTPYEAASIPPEVR